MFALPGYEIETQIHRGPRSSVFRAKALRGIGLDRELGGDRVIVKLSTDTSADPTALLRFRNEFRLGSSITNPHVVRYLALEPCGPRVALVEEDVGARSLAEHLADRGTGLGVEAALDVATKVARGLADVHAHEVIHRAVHPGNILFEASTGRTQIIDFADATLIRQHVERRARPRPQTLSGGAAPARKLQLGYISPEQTGRTDREVDHRTDFYSLGATLYHMLAGHLPFEEDDPLALLHAHIARRARPLRDLARGIPDVVSDLVERLLAKDPDDRYQSAQGVAADLEDALARLRTTGRVDPFPLGHADAPDHLELPSQLYGREHERVLVHDAFEKARGGGRLLLLVAGHSGVGKSSLVHEVRASVADAHGFFLHGKFDVLHRNAPYAALGAALRQLCDELLSQNESELQQWRERILARLGANASLVVEVVPELETILGPQPPAPRTGVVESQNRLTLAFQWFVSVIASEAHPLVLFLDDLQWGDPATLHVVTALLTSPEITHLLVVGAYRPDEISAAHPLAAALSDLRQASARVPIVEVALADLTVGDVEALLVDTLRATPSTRARVATLAAIVHEKTSGNPFFVDEMLRVLVREKALRFSSTERAWVWDRAQIEALGMTANVIELMLRRLRGLAEPTERAVRTAACIGDDFSLSTLAQTLGTSEGETRARLEPAIRARFVLPIDAAYPFDDPLDGDMQAVRDGAPDYRYRFLHDRVRQAAYELTPEGDRAALHVAIGRILLAQTASDPRAREGRLFDIVDQLARGLALIESPAERLVVADLALRAGRKARSATAYAAGRAYLATGLEALPADAFESHYDLAYQLHWRAAECAYLAGLFDAADKLADALLPRLRSPVERAELYTVRIALEANRNHYERSVALGREALAALGIDVPVKPGPVALGAVLARAQVAKVRRRGSDLATLPALSDARLRAAISIIEQLFAPAYFIDPKLFFWLVHECLRISLTHGNAPSSSVGYASYGVLLVAVMGQYETAERFGELAVALADRDGGVERRAKLSFMFGFFISHFRNHARKSLELTRRSMTEGLESGDLVYASIASVNHAFGALIVGDSLDEVTRLAEVGARFVRPLRHRDVSTMFVMLKQLVRGLRGETRSLGSLTSDGVPGVEETVDEAAILAEVSAAEAQIMLAIFVMAKVELLYRFHEPKAALTLVLKHDEVVEATTAGQLRYTEHAFFVALTCIAALRASTSSADDLRAARRLLARKRSQLDAWAKNGPENYLHKQLLVAAESADLAERFDEATELYERAMREARASGYDQHAALAAELAGLSFERRKRAAIASTYLRDARSGYARWGATAKVRQLDARFPELAPPPIPDRRDDMGESLDLVSALRASQAISSEMNLGRLLERILRLIVENAGAERGALVVAAAEGELRVEATLDVRSGELAVLTGAPLDGAASLPEGVLRFVARTGEDVVLADASRIGPFVYDPYVRARGAKSLLCIPVRHQDRITGVLFLENELTASAFTTKRLEVLRFLVAQAAISLENARLYDSTQTLNRALRESQARLEAFLEGLPVALFVLEPDGAPSFANRQARAIVGVDEASSAADAYAAYDMRVAGSDAPYPTQNLPLARALRGETTMVDDVEAHVRPSAHATAPDAGSASPRIVPLALWGTPIRNADGGVRYAVVAFQDISAQRAAERERARLEEQLGHAERLESVGRLAGGVAHDFNNLLTPILFCSQLALRSLPEGSRAHAQITEVLAAAERAAELTRQLLAFGRKEVIDARVLEIGAEVQDFLRVLRRLVRDDIEILFARRDEALVRADRTHVQRIVMNLAMNAADAMPEGGRLTIETGIVDVDGRDAPRTGRGIPSGSYAALRVIDTGSGMDARTRQRIFEPFFTTKGPGKGTGLGLPTVHGLVAQHHGFIEVTSEVGRGSAFEVLFPRIERTPPSTPAEGASTNVPPPSPSAAAAAGLAPPRSVPPSEAGTLLVVEDDDAVRRLLVTSLEDEGYDVVATGDPVRALALGEALGDGLALVISDVVMPSMNGRELVRALTATRPDLRVLYVSGYPDSALSEEGVLEPGVHLLRKPFSAVELRTRVRDLLVIERARSAEPSA